MEPVRRDRMVREEKEQIRERNVKLDRLRT